MDLKKRQHTITNKHTNQNWCKCYNTTRKDILQEIPCGKAQREFPRNVHSRQGLEYHGIKQHGV